MEPDNFAGSRVEQYRLYFSVTRTARLFPPFYTEHRKRLQQSKVGAALLSLVEISNNRFGVDVMMCGPPIGWKSSYFVIKAGNMFGRFEPLKHPLNDCVDILCFYMSVYMFVFWRHP